MSSSSQFISRMCYSLLFFSTLNKSSKYLGFDNLGYKDVILFIKGGKSIRKTGKSKFYSLIYPINESVIPFLGQNDKIFT